jgi:hypothetical protein
MMAGLSGKVMSDPSAELTVRNAKYVKNCVELYLARKGIEELCGFERFVNLESLWINDNRLVRITGLEKNFRIKSLFAHNNAISSLSGSLRVFKFLDALHLQNNRLSNLDKCLGVLGTFAHLHTLDLRNNPLTQEDNYRLRVLFALPWLQVLDCHAVRADEVRKAKLMFGPRGEAASRELAQLLSKERPDQRPAEELAGDWSLSALLLFEELEAAAARRAAKQLHDAPGLEERRAADAKEQRAELLKPSFWPQLARSKSDGELVLSPASPANQLPDGHTQHRISSERYDRFSMLLVRREPGPGFTTERGALDGLGLLPAMLKFKVSQQAVHAMDERIARAKSSTTATTWEQHY